MITKAVLISVPIFFTLGIIAGIANQTQIVKLFTALTSISVVLWSIIFWFKMFGKIGMIL